MSSLWSFVGGAANTLLEQRKRDMAAKIEADRIRLMEELQIAREQRAAERDRDKENIKAESDRLDRERKAEEDAKRFALEERRLASQEDYQKGGLSLRAQELAASREERDLRRAEQEDYRAERESAKAEDKAKSEAYDIFDRISRSENSDLLFAANKIMNSPAPATLKLQRMRELAQSLYGE